MARNNKEAVPSACPIDLTCLGMCSWTNCPGNADVVNSKPHLPSVEEPHPSVSLLRIQPLPSVERFATVTDKELAKLSEGLIPANTNTIVGGIYVIVIVVVASHRFVKMNAQSLVAIVL